MDKGLVVKEMDLGVHLSYNIKPLFPTLPFINLVADL